MQLMDHKIDIAGLCQEVESLLGSISIYPHPDWYSLLLKFAILHQWKNNKTSQKLTKERWRKISIDDFLKLQKMHSDVEFQEIKICHKSHYKLNVFTPTTKLNIIFLM